MLDFQGTNTTSTRLKFEWSPPYHVPGIPCCNSYSVNITNTESGIKVVKTINGSDSTSVILDVFEEHLCSLYEIQISAVNDLGEGEVMKTKWSLGGMYKIMLTFIID